MTYKWSTYQFKGDANKVGEELEQVSGIKGLRFCHTGRFIVSCNNLDAVYKVLDKLCQ